MDHQGAVSCPSLVRSPLIESGSVESAASGSPLYRVASDHHHHHHSSGSSSSSVGSDSSLSQDSVGRSLEELLEEDGEDEALSGHVGCYQMGELLGKGAFGRVFKGLNTKTGKFVAIKEMNLTDSEFVATELPKVMGEIQLLRQLDHPNIVRYIDFFQGADSLHIILEYIENGSLHDIVSQYGKFPESLTAIYISQVLCGLAYLHDRNIIHRDIKGANILITKGGVCKLADFGVATKLEGGVKSLSAVGTPYWMAPEIFEGEEVTESADIWSLGCTVLELIDGKYPYAELGPMNAMFRIIEDAHPPFPAGISTELEQFLLCCFNRDPAARWSAKQLMGHPWLRNATAGDTSESSNDSQTLDNLRATLRARNTTKLEALPDTNSPEVFSEFISALHAQPLDLLREICDKRASAPSFTQRAERCSDTSEFLALCREMDAEHDTALSLASDITSKLHHGLTEISQHWKRANRERDRYLLAFKLMGEKIELLEQNFVANDEKLAKLLYNSLAMTSLKNATRGVLYTKRSDKVKWVKRYIALKDDFLFLYRTEENGQGTPVEVIRLKQIEVNETFEKDSGKKNSFRLATNKRTYDFYAASAQIVEKWINSLSFARKWWEVQVDGNQPMQGVLKARQRSFNIRTIPVGPSASASRLVTAASEPAIQVQRGGMLRKSGGNGAMAAAAAAAAAITASTRAATSPGPIQRHASDTSGRNHLSRAAARVARPGSTEEKKDYNSRSRTSITGRFLASRRSVHLPSTSRLEPLAREPSPPPSVVAEAVVATEVPTGAPVPLTHHRKRSSLPEADLARIKEDAEGSKSASHSGNTTPVDESAPGQHDLERGVQRAFRSADGDLVQSDPLAVSSPRGNTTPNPTISGTDSDGEDDDGLQHLSAATVSPRIVNFVESTVVPVAIGSSPAASPRSWQRPLQHHQQLYGSGTDVRSGSPRSFGGKVLPPHSSGEDMLVTTRVTAPLPLRPISGTTTTSATSSYASPSPYSSDDLASEPDRSEEDLSDSGAADLAAATASFDASDTSMGDGPLRPASPAESPQAAAAAAAVEQDATTTTTAAPIESDTPTAIAGDTPVTTVTASLASSDTVVSTTIDAAASTGSGDIAAAQPSSSEGDGTPTRTRSASCENISYSAPSSEEPTLARKGSKLLGGKAPRQPTMPSMPVRTASERFHRQALPSLPPPLAASDIRVRAATTLPSTPDKTDGAHETAIGTSEPPSAIPAEQLSLDAVPQRLVKSTVATPLSQPVAVSMPTSMSMTEVASPLAASVERTRTTTGSSLLLSTSTSSSSSRGFSLQRTFSLVHRKETPPAAAVLVSPPAFPGIRMHVVDDDGSESAVVEQHETQRRSTTSEKIRAYLSRRLHANDTPTPR